MSEQVTAFIVFMVISSTIPVLTLAINGIFKLFSKEY